MRKLGIIGMFVILTLLLGCEFFPSEMQGETPSEMQGQTQDRSFIITSIEASSTKGIVPRGIAQRSSEETYELWLMPTQRGNNEPITHRNMQYLKKFSMNEDSTYEIPLSEFPEADPSVVFIMRIIDETNTDLVGFLGLKVDDDHSIIEFPPRTEMTDDISFGIVQVSDDSYVSTSELSLADNEGSFSETTLLALQQQAITANLALMAINILTNTHEDVYYAPALSLRYDLNDTADWGRVSLSVYSREYTKKAALFTPQGVNLNYSGDYKAGFGERSSVQWEVGLPLQDFIEKAKKGDMWLLKDEDGTVLAEFDFSIALVLDDNDNPIVPRIEPTYTVKADDSSLVDTLSFNWYYMDSDGTTTIPMTDEDELASLVLNNSLYMDYHSGDSSQGTYMFRPRGSGGCYGMQGTLLAATNFDMPLKVADLDKLSIGYRFTFYNCNTQWKTTP